MKPGIFPHTVIWLLLPTLLFAQSPKVQKADEQYATLAFAKAIDLYQAVLKKEEDNAHAAIRLADCYRMVNDFENAERWYRKVVTYKESQPVHLLYFGEALMQNEKYDEARTQFERYTDLRPDDSRGWNGIVACNSIAQFRATKDDYQIQNLPINTSLADFGPVFYGEGIVFASERGKGATFDWTGRPFLNMWFAKVDPSGSWTNPEGLTGSAQTLYHDGPATFTADEQTMFFTRNNVTDNNKTEKSEKNMVELKIMKATRGDRSIKWGQPEDIGISSKDFSTAHPALAPDGKTLFFTSDRPGGRGGTDIWMSHLEGSTWSEPVNLGAVINTEGNEMFPYMSKDSTLYFASNGHPGLGGLDIFSAKFNPVTGTFGNVRNMGAPINSSRDDFAMAMKDNALEGYFTSNRPGGKGDDDIYSFRAVGAQLEVYVYDCNTSEPVTNATVKVRMDESVVVTAETDEEGKMYAMVQRNRSFTCSAHKTPYDPQTTTFNTVGTKPGEVVHVEMCLGGKCVVQGIVREKNSMEPLEVAEVTLTNNRTGDQMTVATGGDGRYRFDVEPGDYTITARKVGYAYDEQELKVGALPGEPCAVTMNLSLDFLDVLVMENIYYDFDKANIREDASTDLQKLLRILQDNPKMRVELASHTDSRGSHPYNVGLSQRRAQSVVNWLVARGIAQSRLVAKGYGETQLRNHCSDGAQCTEYEHQRNRRSEIAVIDERGKRMAGREKYNDPEAKFEYVPGGYHGDRPRTE